MAEILNLLEEFISEEKPQRWAKLASTVSYRRLHLALLREILIELRKLNTALKKER